MQPISNCFVVSLVANFVILFTVAAAMASFTAVPPILFAATYGDTMKISQLLDNGTFVDDRDWVGQTALHMAAKFGQDDAARVLLERGADPRVVNNDYNETPLHLAAKTGYLAICELLLAYGANINAKSDKGDFSGGTPLHYATLVANSLTTVQYLVENSADVNARNIFNETAVHQAVSKENLAVVKLLHQKGANLSAQNNAGNTPLHVALGAMQPQLPIVKFLVDNGANLYAKDNKLQTPIDIAGKRGLSSAILLMVNARGKTKQSFAVQPLHLAAGLGDYERLLSLLSGTVRFINVNAQDDYGRTALHIAIQFQQIECARLLLHNGANVNSKDQRGYTPLHVAAKTGNVNTIKLLIENGADIEAWQTDVATPLLAAVKFANAYIPAVEVLIVNGARHLQEALNLALINQNTQMAEIIIEHGANVSAESAGQTPLVDLLRSGCCYPQIPVLGFLIDRGASLNGYVGEAGETPLQATIKARKRKEVIEYLLYRGADPKLSNAQGCDAPLYLAVKIGVIERNSGSINKRPINGTTDIARVLLRYGAIANDRDNCSGKTAIQLLLSNSAAQQRNPGLVKMLHHSQEDS